LFIDSKWFLVKAEDYILEVEGSCILGFLDGGSSPYWLLGDAFLKGYYSIHDNDDHANARIGIVPHSNSNKPFVESGSAPIKSYKDIKWERSWIYEYYWFWQIEDWTDKFFLDDYWWYEW